MPRTPAVVSLHIWGVPTRHVATAVTRMARHRRPARTLPGVQFAKLLGTGTGQTFTPRDADPHHWGVLLCWSDDRGPEQLRGSRLAADWDRIAEESATWIMRPLSSRGLWSGTQPFGDPTPTRWDGPVAALTRGRIRPRMWRTFWSSVPPVALDVHSGGGLTFATGIGEAPIGLQGTFSTWSDGAALTDFAHRRSPHQQVIAQTSTLDWYSEELFARFALLEATGTVAGRAVTGTGLALPEHQASHAQPEDPGTPPPADQP
jgi:hypothetical protein